MRLFEKGRKLLEITSFLAEYDKEYWDFNGVKKEGLHKLGKYPATMVAPMQYELLSILINNNNFNTLLDPFMGEDVIIVTRGENAVFNRVLKLPQNHKTINWCTA